MLQFLAGVRKSPNNTFDEVRDHLDYWLSRSPEEKIAAVTFLVAQSIQEGNRMDKTIVAKRKLRLGLNAQ